MALEGSGSIPEISVVGWSDAPCHGWVVGRGTPREVGGQTLGYYIAKVFQRAARAVKKTFEKNGNGLAMAKPMLMTLIL